MVSGLGFRVQGLRFRMSRRDSKLVPIRVFKGF